MTFHPDPDGQPSAPDLVSTLLSGLSRLVRGEVALAQAEAKRSLQGMMGALIAVVVAVILGITALNVLAAAAVAGLVVLGMSTLWASVAVGVALLIVAGVLVIYARRKLTPSNLAPTRSIKNLQRDAQTLKSMVKSGATANIHS